MEVERSMLDVGRCGSLPDPSPRLDYLDATRAFALLLGVVFHASLSFTPYFMGWAVQDISTGAVVADFFVISHSFRMELFFLLAGYFSHALFQRQGAGPFLRSRAIRLGVPFAAGWFLLRPLVVSGWTMGAASMRGDYDFWAGIRAGFASLRQLPAGLFTGSHLWFLYYLLLVTGLLLVLRVAATTATRALAGETGLMRIRGRVDASVGWLARSGWGLPLLVLPTAVALWYMRFWNMDTPDQSLRPHLPVLAVYGGFFSLGWLFARQADPIVAFGRITLLKVVLLIAGVVATLKLNPIQGDPAHEHFQAAHMGFVSAYATMMWTLVALTLGVFRKIFAQPRPAIRYVADSSYWMYLMHLPVVVWLQVAVAEWPLHWSLKLALVSVATIALALLTYDLFVRSTWLGQLLNGRRRDRVLFARRSQQPQTP
jgi:peptidoglycan/LPS O-acetylase OafA/YrhL